MKKLGQSQSWKTTLSSNGLEIADDIIEPFTLHFNAYNTYYHFDYCIKQSKQKENKIIVKQKVIVFQKFFNIISK